MKAIVKEVKPNNYTIDFEGIGVKQFEFTSEELMEIIYQDLLTNYNCITHLTTQVKMEEGIYVATNLQDNTKLTIRMYMKTNQCEEVENMLGVISSYLRQAFIRCVM